MNKIHLQTIAEKEAKELFSLINRNKERLARYFPLTLKKNENIDSTINYLKELTQKTKKKEIYALGIYSQQVLIGMMFVKNIDWRVPKCELGYFIDKAYEGKGIMSIAIDETIKYCFENLKMEKIFLRNGTENIGSKRLAEKKGFELEGIMRREFRLETKELVDVEYYGKLKTPTKNS
ncbi:GNAT family N-acetyltransferase [Arenibacter algicola]|uniref:GNAT family N-acetyltransferase n=1 Tax=Arenibacter algicola TaxID=616991 RepID=UPI001C079409|nr:GNAT family protein [Arenibacter algicola]MBU2906452.1 GNAT family N-acetyltransferase [Arenibacter algicola]